MNLFGGPPDGGPPCLSETNLKIFNDCHSDGANATRNLLFAGGGPKQIPPLRFAHRRNDKELEWS
jgi:hypothetical protein